MSYSLDLKDTTHTLNNHKIVAIDPGVRTFLTCYTQDGDIMEIGKNNDEHKEYLTDDQGEFIINKKTNKYIMKKTGDNKHLYSIGIYLDN